MSIAASIAASAVAEVELYDWKVDAQVAVVVANHGGHTCVAAPLSIVRLTH